MASPIRGHSTAVSCVLPLLLMITTQACAPGAAARATATVRPGPSAIPSALATPAGSGASPTSPTTLPPLVGEWRLDRTCTAIVAALTDPDLAHLLTSAQQREVSARDIAETIKGAPGDGTLPSTWDPKHPCAQAMPPTKHSHTFWADGRFNSYDETGRQVDDGNYELDGPDILRMSGWTWTYRVDNDQLTLDPILPVTCDTPECVGDLAWAFSVAYPGQHWTRVLTGPHVPPGSGPSN